MKTYSLWLVVIDPSIQKEVVIDPSIQKEVSYLLINNGFSIKALAEDGMICGSEKTTTKLGHPLAYNISCEKEKIVDVGNEIDTLLDKNNIKVCFRLITEKVNCQWNYSNVKIDRELVEKILKKFPGLASLL